MDRIKVNSKVIKITHSDKVLFSKGNVTKKEMIEYYFKMSKYMLPHMKDRPISMQRFPNGIDKEGFYQKEAGDYFPKWIKRARIKKKRGHNSQVLCNDAETLVYLANQDVITSHIWLSKIDKIYYPDKMVFDFDPPKSRKFDIVRKGALTARKVLEELGLKPFVMTTGSRGLHVVIPIKREYDFDFVREFAGRIAKVLEKKYPKDFTTEVRKNKRRGRLFLDIMRNAYAQHSVAPYSLRALEGAPVATPISWSEVSIASPQKYNIKNIFKRVNSKGDIWKEIDKKTVSLKRAERKV